MLGLQTIIATGLGTLFTYIGIGVVVLVIAYSLYAYCKNQRTQNQANDFVDIREKRQQKVDRVEGFTAEDTLRLQQQTDSIMTGIQQQRDHLGALIQDFAQELNSIQTVGENLDHTSDSLRDRIIGPFQALFEKMRQQFQMMCSQIQSLSLALTDTNTAAAAREKELSQLLANLKEIEPELSSGLAAIKNIQQKGVRDKERIKRLEKTNDSLTQTLTDLTMKTQKMAKIQESQKGLIELLKNRIAELEDSTETVQSMHPSKRSTPSQYGKYNPNLFPQETELSPHVTTRTPKGSTYGNA